MTTTQVLTVVVDWNEEKREFLSPSISDAVSGLVEILTATFWFELQNKKATTNPDIVDIRLYYVDVDEETKLMSTNRVKMFETKLELYPQRLQVPPAAIDRPEPPPQQENIVSLN